MDSHVIHVMTIANSIIGVSIIAMPFCFKQCGIILSILMLIISSIISRLSCHFLLKSAIKARLRTFEFLAYHAFGPFGKFMVEVGMIGFLLGTCIAFFVVMGDLGPEIMAEMLGLKNTNTLRSGILVALAFFCVLPLGLLRNVDSLSGVSVATVGFYICLVLKIMAESASHIITGDWYDRVDFWRTEGVLQCIPIFSMALFCQTQLFEIYQAIPNASLDKMNALIRIAVNICTCVYVFVGVFGYIAVADKPFTGNILLGLKPSLLTEIIKIGFVLSLAFSFPLIIFPCRASLYSLIYKPTYTSLHDGGTHFIPETKFRSLTILIIVISLGVGILIPNIELVLGLVGSTIGVSICVLFPATCFICMVQKNTNERILAQLMLCIGIIVMVLGTYANLNAADDITLGSISEHPPLKVAVPKIEEKLIIDIPTTVKLDVASMKYEKNENKNIIQEVRHESPQPIVPLEQSKEREVKEIVPELPPLKQHEPQLQEVQLKEIRHEPPQPVEPEHNVNQIKSGESQEIPNAKNENKKVTDNIPKENISSGKHSPEKLVPAGYAIADQVDAEAIKKEDKEINQQAQEELRNVVQKLDLISELQKQNQAQQQQIVEQQQKIWEEMKQRNDVGQEKVGIKKVNEETLKAVQQIEDIAKKAIKSLVDDDPKSVEAKAVESMQDPPKLVNFIADANVSILDKLKANPAPLSYQLGLNVINNTGLEKSNIVKSSIFETNNTGANANHNSSGYASNIAKGDDIAPITPPKDLVGNKTENANVESHKDIDASLGNSNAQIAIHHKENLDKINAETKEAELKEVKAMRRDILSENLNNSRGKRDLPVDNCINNPDDVHCEQNKSQEYEILNEGNKESILLNSLKSSNDSRDRNSTENAEENCDKS